MKTSDATEHTAAELHAASPETLAVDERALDGDFVIEGDSGGTDNGSQTQIVPPPRPPEN